MAGPVRGAGRGGRLVGIRPTPGTSDQDRVPVASWCRKTTDGEALSDDDDTGLWVP